MKIGFNDIKYKNKECITGKYKLLYTFPENLGGFPLFITKISALESYR